MKTLTIKDESMSGDILREIEVALKGELTTVREIISARVEAEVALYNERRSVYFQGFVQPKDTERTLNGYKFKAHRQIDPEKQVYIALDAFTKNGYFVLIDNVQAESLDQEVLVDDQTRVSFIQLTPLVGG
ncbi:MAG: hypothetical protein AAGG75_11230 [Bacteroidota bacterium]